MSALLYYTKKRYLKAKKHLLLCIENCQVQRTFRHKFRFGGGLVALDSRKRSTAMIPKSKLRFTRTKRTSRWKGYTLC